jgi:PAS domain S-box-containing protein
VSEHRADEEELLRSVALQNATSILAARQRAERELLRTKEELERRTDELARSLSVMRATLESAPDGILVTDEAGRVADCNGRWASLWSLSAEQLNACDHACLLEMVAPQLSDPPAFMARAKDIELSSPPQTFDVLALADGRTFERFSKIQVVEERTVGRVWIVRDVTEQKRAEAALRDETRILELLNETGTKIASTLDIETLVQFVTDASTLLSGAKFGAFFYSKKNEQNEFFTHYVLAGAPRAAFDGFGHPRATDLFGPTFGGEGAIRCSDVQEDPRYGKFAPHFGMPAGHMPVRSYLAVPVVSRTSAVIGGLFFGHPEPGVFTERAERLVVGVAGQAAVAMDNARLYDDVSRAARERARLLDAERAARTELERISVMKDEFLATLSHELRTPLNAILGWAELLATRDVSDDVRRGLQVITRNAKAQTQLIADLLDMSRIISGKLRLDVQRADLAGLVSAAVDAARPAADAKELRLRQVLDPVAGPVAGDPNRLQQIVWNLLSNAIKFTPKGGTVDIWLERVNSHVEITVRDSGVGIGPVFLPHVFERFQQADSSSTRKYGGLGLGLAIVKQLVELHGGTIRAESQGEGHGASFVVTLPLAPVRNDGREHPTSWRPPSLDSEELSLEGVRVLVVDDEPDARELIKAVLTTSAADVNMAGSASEGLSLLATFRPHVIVSDIGMPDVDGYQFIRQVRSLHADAGGRTPAVALTAFARSEDRTRAIRAGFQIHIAKPIEPQELLATIASLVERVSSPG